MSRVMEAANKRLTPLPETTQDDLDRMIAKCNRLRPIERAAKEQLERQIRIASVARRFPHGSVLNLDVLRWRYSMRHLRANVLRVPVPKLALIHLNDPTFYLKRSERKIQDTSTLPKGLAEKVYGDILKQLSRAVVLGKRYTLSYSWSGIIPESASDTIKKAEEVFGSYQKQYSASRGEYDENPRVYLLAEAPFGTWSVESEPVPRPPKLRHLDPLIVGHHGDELFVVGSFDPTPLEQYIALEFTTKELMPAEER